MSMKAILVLAILCFSVNADLVFLNDDAKAKCPTFSCSTSAGTDGQCLSGKGKLVDGRKVELNQCEKEGFYCPVKPATDFFADTDATEKCAETPKPAVAENYPGEPCATENGDDCKSVFVYDTEKKDFVATKKCTAKVCVGAKKDENCKTDADCVVGHYCKAGEKVEDLHVCVAQLEKDAACTSTFQCKNTLICSDSKCVDAYSFDLGASVEKVDVSGQYLACANGSPVENKCAILAYKKDDKTTVENGLVKCDYQSKCNYEYLFKADGTDKKDATSQDCVCSLSSTGQGYCPMAQDTDSYKSYFTNQKTRLDNKRHTLARTLGDFDKQTDAKCASFSVNVLFKDVDTCTKKVTGFSECNSSILKYSLIILAIFAAIFA